jgi:hypothetical protein
MQAVRIDMRERLGAELRKQVLLLVVTTFTKIEQHVKMKSPKAEELILVIGRCSARVGYGASHQQHVQLITFSGYNFGVGHIRKFDKSKERVYRDYPY